MNTTPEAHEAKLDAQEEAYYRILDDAIEAIERGEDVGPKCDQDSLRERLDEHPGYFRMVLASTTPHTLAERESNLKPLAIIVNDTICEMCQDYAHRVVKEAS